MVLRVLEYIERYGMIEPGDHIVAGISGGADSVCLLFVLRALMEQLSFKLTAVHVEHGLRGAESLEDAAFVERLCEETGIPCRVFHVDMEARAREEGLSPEEAGRELRYACFSRALEEAGANKIAVAHQLEDQGETLLLQLFRGAGLRGLCGMAPVRGRIIRPLLEISRRDMEEWLADQGISWRTDRTNLETAYTRNRLRLELLPYVEREIQPRAKEHLAKTAGRLRQVQEYLDRQAEKAYRICAEEIGERSEKKVQINLEALGQQEPLMRTMVLQLALSRLGGGLRDVGAVHLEALLALAGKETGKAWMLPGGLAARREYGSLILEKKREPESGFFTEVTEIPGIYRTGGLTWRFSVEEAKNSWRIPEKTYTKWFDYDTIKKCLSIRTRSPGDFLEINREHGKKKLKDYLIDCKIPRREREELLLLTEGKHVLWILGHRISQAYKITGQTRRLLKVEVFGGDTNDGEDQGDDS